MIKKKITLLGGLLALLLLFGGCSLEDDGPNFHFATLEITGADLPESFVLSQTYRINFTYLRPDSCTFYDYPDVRKPHGENTRNVVAIGLVRTDATDCEVLNVEETASFDFSVIFEEPYLFRFFTGEDENGEPEYLEVTVPVEEP
ncbi:hypothetical protein [Maribacter sp. 2307ULW6-5]|uniref:hypothetical protein n=1 Tax=Maribacter sp. 2307ULW6-5 TaxID=3386275 RepID=UPI0039BC38CA